MEGLDAELAKLVRAEGYATLEKPTRLRNMLLDLCPKQRTQVSIVMQGLAAGIPDQLGGESARGGKVTVTAATRMRTQLRSQCQMSTADAEYAIRTLSLIHI